MKWLITFTNSSIGKKYLMGTTGLLLCLFIAQHLIGNMMLFGGKDMFNAYVKTLSSFKPLVRFVEVILSIIFTIHIVNAIKLSRENRKAGSLAYQSNASSENSDVSSRTMGISGSIILIFLITHLSTIWYRFQQVHGADEYYDIVIGSEVGFGNPLYVCLYTIAMILMGFHLRHGFQSAFTTFGLSNSKYKNLIEKISIIFWFIIPAGFASIALWFGIVGA